MTPKINWHPTSRDIRQFGWTILIGFGVIGLVFFFRHKQTVAIWMWSLSLAVCLCSLVMPNISKGFYFVWMGFGFVMGTVTSNVIRFFIFFFVLTPVALFFRLVKRDALMRKKAIKESYWIDHVKIDDPEYYDHLA